MDGDPVHRNSATGSPRHRAALVRTLHHEVRVMSIRCLRTPLLGMILGAAVFLFGVPQARAVGENPTIDGDLTDLIAAVNANLGPDKGGFTFTDPLGDIYTAAPCAYVNGYDIVKAYSYFRFKDGTG